MPASVIVLPQNYYSLLQQQYSFFEYFLDVPSEIRAHVTDIISFSMLGGVSALLALLTLLLIVVTCIYTRKYLKRKRWDGLSMIF